mmetsp:Transcript_88390/g.270528  ORF Transcript_88390/g.270528 Transcript_88390/m.270528 type:complete len:283 (-) Transcript_88390:178-1026(-)
MPEAPSNDARQRPEQHGRRLQEDGHAVHGGGLGDVQRRVRHPPRLRVHAGAARLPPRQRLALPRRHQLRDRGGRAALRGDGLRPGAPAGSEALQALAEGHVGDARPAPLSGPDRRHIRLPESRGLARGAVAGLPVARRRRPRNPGRAFAALRRPHRAVHGGEAQRCRRGRGLCISALRPLRRLLSPRLILARAGRRGVRRASGPFRRSPAGLVRDLQLRVIGSQSSGDDQLHQIADLDEGALARFPEVWRDLRIALADPPAFRRGPRQARFGWWDETAPGAS